MHKNLPNLFVFLDNHQHHIFNNNIKNLGVIYRNYNSTKRENELIKISKACRKKRYQLFVSNDIKLATKVKANGVYIPSFNKIGNFRNLENRNLLLIGSAHNQKEIQKKVLQKCSAIFLSPLFKISKSKTFLDIHKFNLHANLNNINVFALGGISEKNIKKLKLLNIRGFGGISIFKKKPALKKAGFSKNNFFSNLNN